MDWIRQATQTRGGRYLLTFIVLSVMWVPIGAVPGSDVASASTSTAAEGSVELPYIVASGDFDGVDVEWHNVPDNVASVEVHRATYDGLEAGEAVNLTPNGVSQDSFRDRTVEPATTYQYEVKVKVLYPDGKLPEVERFGAAHLETAAVGDSLGSDTVATSAPDPDDIDDEDTDDEDGLGTSDNDPNDPNDQDEATIKTRPAARPDRVETLTFGNPLNKAENFLCQVPALAPEACGEHEYGSLGTSSISEGFAPASHFDPTDCIKSGTITSETWSPGDCPDGYFVEGDVGVSGTLTLAAGTQVFLNVTSTVTHTAGVDDVPDIIVTGTVNSNGTAAAPVRITSIQTNFIDTGSSPSPGDWGVLLFTPASSGSLAHTKIEYGTGVVAHEALPAVSFLEISNMNGAVGMLPYRNPADSYSASLDFYNPSGPVSWDALNLSTPGIAVPGAVIYSSTSTVTAGLTVTITNSHLEGLAPLQIINMKEDAHAPITVSISGNAFHENYDAYGLSVVSLVFDENGGVGNASVTGSISNNTINAPAIGGWGFLGAAVSADGAATHTISFTNNTFASYVDASDNIAFSGGDGDATLAYTVSSGNYRSNNGIGWLDLASAGKGGALTVGDRTVTFVEGDGSAIASPVFDTSKIESKGGESDGSCETRCGLWVGAFAADGTATAFPRVIDSSAVETSTGIGGVYLLSEATGAATTDFHLIDSSISAGGDGLEGYAFSSDAGVLLDADITRSSIKSFNGFGADLYGEAHGTDPDPATSDVNVVDSTIEGSNDAVQIDVYHFGIGTSLIDIEVTRSTLRSNSSSGGGSDGVDALLVYYGGALLGGDAKIKAAVTDSTIRTTNGDGLDLDVRNHSTDGATELDVDVVGSTFIVEGGGCCNGDSVGAADFGSDGHGIFAWAATTGDGNVTTDVFVSTSDFTLAGDSIEGIHATADAGIDTGGDASTTVRLRDSSIDLLDGDEGIEADAWSGDGGDSDVTVEVTRSEVLTEDDSAVDAFADAAADGNGGNATTDIDVVDSTLSVRSGCCGDSIEADARSDGDGDATLTVDILRSTLFSNDDDGMDLEANANDNGDGGGGNAKIVVNVTDSSIGVTASDNEENIEADSDTDSGGHATVEVNIRNSRLHSTEDDNLDLFADAIDNGVGGGGNAVVTVTVTDSELLAIEACCDDNIEADTDSDGGGMAKIDITVLRSTLRAEEDDVFSLDANAVSDSSGGGGDALVNIRVTDSELSLDTTDSEEVFEADARTDGGGDAIIFVSSLNTDANSIDNIVDLNANAVSDSDTGGGDARVTFIARDSRWTVPDSSGDQEIDARTDGGGDASIDVTLTNMDLDLYDGWDLESHAVNSGLGGDGDAAVRFSISDSLFNVFDSSDDHFEVDADSGNGGDASIGAIVLRSHLEGFDCCIEQLNLDADATNSDDPNGGSASIEVSVIDSTLIAQDCCGDGMEIDARSHDGGHSSVDVNVDNSLFEHEDDNINIDANADDDVCCGHVGGGNAFVTVTVTDSDMSSIDSSDENIEIDASAVDGGHASVLVTVDPTEMLAGDENIAIDADAYGYDGRSGGGNAGVTVTVLDSNLQITDSNEDNITARTDSNDGGDATTLIQVHDSQLSAGDENINAEAHAAQTCCGDNVGGGDAKTTVIVTNTPMHNVDCCDNNIEADSWSDNGGNSETIVSVDDSPMSSDDENISAAADAAVNTGCCALAVPLANGGGGTAAVTVTVTDSPMQSADSSDDNMELDAFASGGGDALIKATVLRSDMVAGDDNIDADASAPSGEINGALRSDVSPLPNGGDGGDAKVDITVTDSEMVIPEGGSSDSNFELDAESGFGGDATIIVDGARIDARNGGGHGIDADASASGFGDDALSSDASPAANGGGGNAHVTTTLTDATFLTRDQAVVELFALGSFEGDATTWTDFTNVSLTSLDGCSECSGEGIQADALAGFAGHATYGGPLTNVDIDAGGHAIEANAISGGESFPEAASFDAPRASLSTDEALSLAADGFSPASHGGTAGLALTDPILTDVTLKSGQEDGMNFAAVNAFGDAFIVPVLTGVDINAPNSDGTVFVAFGIGELNAAVVDPTMTNVNIDVENHGLQHVASDIFAVVDHIPNATVIVVAGQYDTVNIDSNGGEEEFGEAVQMAAINFDSFLPALAVPEFRSTNAEFFGSPDVSPDVLALSFGCLDEDIFGDPCDETTATDALALTAAVFHPGPRLNWTAWNDAGFMLWAVTLDGAGDAVNFSEVRTYHVRSYYDGINIEAHAMQINTEDGFPAGDAFVDPEVIDNVVEPFAASGGISVPVATGVYVHAAAGSTETVTATANGIVASNQIQNHSEHGIYFYAGGGGSTVPAFEHMDALIAGNTVLNVGAYGIWTGTSELPMSGPDDITRIIDNTIDRTGDSGILVTGVRPDIRSNVQRRSGDGAPFSEGPGFGAAGIVVADVTPEADPGLVQCNSVAGNETGILYTAMEGAPDPVTNQNNFVDVVDPGLVNGPRNLFTDNASATPTDATFNWWGDISPAAIDASAEGAGGADVDTSDAMSKLACTGGYLLDLFGGVHPYGGTGLAYPGTEPGPVVTSGGYTPGTDSARAIATLSSDDPALSRKSGYFVNQFGTIFSFGGAPATTGAPLFGFDIARDIVLLPDATGGYVLDGFGGVHPFSVGANPVPPPIVGGPSFHGFGDIARRLIIRPDGQSGYLLDGFGGMHPWATGDDPLPPPTQGPYFFPRDVVNDAVLQHNGQSGYILDHAGGMHPFSTLLRDAPPLTSGPYWPTGDVARAITRYVDSSVYMLDYFGGRHIEKSFPAGIPASIPGPYFGFDAARDIDGVRYP